MTRATPLADCAFVFDDDRPALAARHLGIARGCGHLWPHGRRFELNLRTQYMYKSIQHATDAPAATNPHIFYTSQSSI